MATEPADQRSHRHDRSHADDDAEDRQRRAKLVGSQRVDRHRENLGEQTRSQRSGNRRLGTARIGGHSRRSASIGLSDAARMAGYKPKNNPTVAVMLIPSATDQVSIVAGSGVNAATPNASANPRAVPIRPPTSESVVD